MKTFCRHVAMFAVSAVVVSIALSETAAGQSRNYSRPLFWVPSGAEVFGGIAGGGAVVGLGIFYAIRHGHSLTGCVVSVADGLELRKSGDRVMYGLLGNLAAVKAGDKVRVSGRKQKQSGTVPCGFFVEKLDKDYGACAVERSSR